MLFTLLQAGYYAEPASGAAHYSAATMGMFVLIIVIGIAGYAVQARLQSVFRKYSKVQFPGGLTGAEVAEKMLRDNNIHNVKVTHVGGNLTDHFNPQTMTVNLSDSVYSSTSVAAAAVAAHECGHAVQHAQGYAPLTLRSQLVPVVQFSSTAATWVIILGLVLMTTTQNALLCWIGVGMIAMSALFSLVAARRVQRLGPRRGVAPDQPHDAGSTARAGQRGPLVGGPHLPRSGVERHRVGALLRLPDPRTARLPHR